MAMDTTQAITIPQNPKVIERQGYWATGLLSAIAPAIIPALDSRRRGGSPSFAFFGDLQCACAGPPGQPAASAFTTVVARLDRAIQ